MKSGYSESKVLGSNKRISARSREQATPYARGWTSCGLRAFRNFIYLFFIFLFFLFHLQSVEILQNGTPVASVPYSITFASRSKKYYDVTEA